MAKKAVTVRLDEEVAARMEAQRREGESVSSCCARVLEDGLDAQQTADGQAEAEGVSDAYVSHLEDEIAHLRGQLEDARDERGQLIAALAASAQKTVRLELPPAEQAIAPARQRRTLREWWADRRAR